MLKVQLYPLEIFSIAGEVMMGLRPMTLADNCSTNLRRKAFDVPGVVGIFACQAAALRERFAAAQRHEDGCAEQA